MAAARPCPDSIDAEAEQQIFAELQRDKASRITIVTSHRAWTLRDVDHIYVLDHGVIVEHGRHEDLITPNGPQRTLCRNVRESNLDKHSDASM